MGLTKEQLLTRLQDLQVGFSQYEHPVVLTVEAQAKYVGHLKGALSKNLFLKDKKQRYYIVSALAETKVDLKVLSQRLGLGKGGVRMAPEEALAEILQVPLGCVTPFALVNETARNVSLLLDQGFKNQECCFFHPLSNDMTITLSTSDLDKFLNSIGKSPAYVDLEANPSVGKDQPPDLASLVPSDATVLAEPLERNLPTQGSNNNNNHISVNKQPAVPEPKTVKPTISAVKGKSQGSEKVQITFADPDKFVQEILEKTTSLVISEIDKKNIDREQLGAVISNSISKQLGVELKNIATIFKNTAYTEGFKAGNQYQPKRM